MSRKVQREHHYHLLHHSGHAYPEPATSSYARAVLLPRDGGGQRVHHAALTVSPRPAEQHEHLDVAGNRSTYLHVAGEHTALEVAVSALLTVTRRRPDVAALPGIGWETAVAAVAAIRSSGRGAQGEGPSSVMAIADGALPSRLAAPDEAVLGYALASFRPATPLVEAVTDLAGRIHQDLEHRPAPPARTTLAEVLSARAGTSHDAAHLMIAGMRAMGLAARYVSGYVTTALQHGREGEHDGGAPHAWVAAWVPGGGWLHIDPVHDRLVDHRYVVLGWGRDLLDVSPLHGVVYAAGRGTAPETRVELTALSEAELAAELAAARGPQAPA